MQPVEKETADVQLTIDQHIRLGPVSKLLSEISTPIDKEPEQRGRGEHAVDVRIIKARLRL